VIFRRPVGLRESGGRQVKALCFLDLLFDLPNCAEVFVQLLSIVATEVRD
jgi:hypothetical protein